MRSCLESSAPHLLRRLGRGLTPNGIFRALARRPGAVHLASPKGFGELSRWTISSCDPFAKLVWREGELFAEGVDLPESARKNPFRALRAALAAFPLERVETAFPVGAGLVGYLAYDLKRYIEKLPETVERDSTLPEMHFGLYDAFVLHDNRAGETYLVGSPVRGERAVAERVDALESVLRGAGPDAPFAEPQAVEPLRSNFTKEAYIEAVKAVCRYIYDGDIFQANLSQRFETRTRCDGASLFERLTEVNPAPFSAYIALEGDRAVLSSSPERFLRVDGAFVETRPIKGTRRRTGEPDRDRTAAAELLSSAKDNAELAMIIDLERNDLGRVADYGTVRVVQKRVLETYPTVFHLVSTVTARLHEDKDLVDLLEAAFPGGSITGAPKIRAMEIIDELEPTARSVYTGSIGYIGFDGRADLNIAIRTILYEAGRVTFQVGGGIVADSDPEAEYEETLDKGRALARSLGLQL